MNKNAEDNKPANQKPGNGYEYDCEPREITDAARKRWAASEPEWAKKIGQKPEAKTE